ncbi:hypothetical protein D9619_003914 [Psilocybe cf. subviscida]|uniref:Uncharacterized protein n=1 Tax=Psilocybe cf. subviscida TaxID=2480587 RepID=A0A8H5BRL4_9AGAR|nr:hypothetical protein D9619_003914 [Psilocybe cf. subviscida]
MSSCATGPGFLSPREDETPLTLESWLLPLLLQALLTGIYINIFLQTIDALLRGGGRKVYATVLTLLFGAIIVNTAVYWHIVRDIMIVHDDNLSTILEETDAKLATTIVVLTVTSDIAIFIADGILIWRCYTLWAQSSLLLLVFSPLFIAEAALIVLFGIPKIWDTGKELLAMSMFVYISATITFLASCLIIYRIASAVGHTEGQTSKYSLTIEVLVESGMLHAASILITSILHIILQATGPLDGALKLLAQTVWGQAVLLPVTGIAPTLIAFRVATGRARDEASWSRYQPLSSLLFKKTPPQSAPSGTIPTNSIITDHSNQSGSHQHSEMITEVARHSLME